MNNTEKIKDLLKEILSKMNVSFEEIVVVDDGKSETPKISVKSSDSALLIGVRGANLFALNHLLKRIVTKGKTEQNEETKFFVDVNDYQVKLNEELKNRAKIMSDRARSFKVDVELDPMSSYERMIIHSALQEQVDIKTESKGFGKDRRVVIRYVEEGQS